MSLVPASKTGKVAFYKTKTGPWSLNATEIGLTAAMTTELTTKVNAADTAIADQNAALSAYHTAVSAADDAVRAMDLLGSECIKSIRAKAAIVGGNTVYELAEIPAPAIPAPIPPPGKPTDFVATLTEGGSLKLAWKCANPTGSQGTIYQVSRRIGEAGAWVTLGVSGYKRFTDSTVPSGVASVTYRIIATRSTAHGDEALFTVNFGVSGGAMTAMVSPRMAA